MKKEQIESIKQICLSLISSSVRNSYDLDRYGKEHVIYYCKFCNALTYDGDPNKIQHKDDCPHTLAINLLREVCEDSTV